jgi:predicted lysophospholipase L1 biosynthesis ABC-type transport system permease subunit
VLVINEALARRYFPGENPVWRFIAWGKPPGARIVGVVANTKQLDLHTETQPEMFHDFRQHLFAPFAAAFTLRTSGDAMQVAAAAQREIRALHPDQPVLDVQTMLDVVRNASARPRFYAVLLAVFAALALLLAAAGLYGVLAYTVSRRTRDIGIRMALGASAGAVFGEVMRSALALVMAGVALGLACSLALTRLIIAQLYRTPPADPVILVSVAALLVAVAALAAAIPARRAVRIDPAAALRCE